MRYVIMCSSSKNKMILIPCLYRNVHESKQEKLFSIFTGKSINGKLYKGRQQISVLMNLKYHLL